MLHFEFPRFISAKPQMARQFVPAKARRDADPPVVSRHSVCANHRTQRGEKPLDSPRPQRLTRDDDAHVASQGFAYLSQDGLRKMMEKQIREHDAVAIPTSEIAHVHLMPRAIRGPTGGRSLRVQGVAGHRAPIARPAAVARAQFQEPFAGTHQPGARAAQPPMISHQPVYPAQIAPRTPRRRIFGRKVVEYLGP